MQKIMFSDKYGLTDAVLQGRKTMKREIIPLKVSNYCDWKAFEEGYMKCYGTGEGDWVDIRRTAKYKVGEVVAVAQSYKTIHEEMMSGDYGDSKYDAFRCAVVAGTKGWTNKMFVRADLMPYRIKITDIKAEKLQDISDEDCLKEGIIRRDDMINSRMEDVVRYTFENSFVGGVYKTYATPREAFAALIERPGIGHKGDWSKNPWVFVYTFKLIK